MFYEFLGKFKKVDDQWLLKRLVLANEGVFLG